jgi:glutamate racemase
MNVAPEEVRRRPVGVFDSGVGGLTVLHELLVRLPHEDYLYLADSARLPYGSKAPERLQEFALEVAEELLARRIKLLVVACNSATAAALPVLRERMMQTTLGVEVLGVVQPAAVQAVAATRSGKVGVLATPATVATGAYAAAIGGIDPFVEVVSVPCDDLAMRIEAETIDDHLMEIVRGYCAPLREAGVDTVILGSTHYPLVRPIIQRMLGPETATVTSGAPLARQVEHVLGTRGLDSPRTGEGSYRFLCTGDPAAFSAQGTRFLQLPLGEVERVRLDGDARAVRDTGGRAHVEGAIAR